MSQIPPALTLRNKAPKPPKSQPVAPHGPHLSDKGWFSIVHTSDVHLAEPTQDPEDMARAMKAFLLYIFEQKVPKDAPLAMFCVDGDLFETLVNLNGVLYKSIYKLLEWIMLLGHEHGLVMRFMRGTFEHDRNQMAHLEAIYETHRYTNDFRYIDRIELEFIEKLNLRILYLPDNLPYGSSDEVLEVVWEKMRERGWDYVDYAHIHGFFTFTCPEVAAAKQKIIYREDQFTFVRKFCHVGHVHIHTAQGNIISNGNPDYISFGEVGPKGMVLDIDKRTTASATFIENPYACPYVTLTFREEDTTEDIVTGITAFLDTLKTTRLIHMRLIISDTEKHAAVRKYMVLYHGDIKFKIEKDKSKARKTAGVSQTPMVKRIDRGNAPSPDTLADYLLKVVPPELHLTREQVTWALAPIKK